MMKELRVIESVAKERFSLKDELFNQAKVEMIACEILSVYSDFDNLSFSAEVLKKFPFLELKERIYHIRDMLHKYLPNNFEDAVDVLLHALPAELDPSKSDDDFGDFIYAPYSEYVREYGCCEEYLDFSLQALREITKRFSVEFAIRDFINIYPVQTLAMLEECARSSNYHERRLASESLRPKLPWAKKLTIDYTLALKHLDLLYVDSTRYVTRSVANHLNDIAKIDAPLVVTTLKRWIDSDKQKSKEMDFIANHALRTLVKDADKEALSLLGYVEDPAIDSGSLVLKSQTVQIGEALEFGVTVKALDEVRLMVDYLIHFRTKAGTLSRKVHKLKRISLKKGECIELQKRHLFRANMSTRTLYVGEHILELQINGTVVSRGRFELK